MATLRITRGLTPASKVDETFSILPGDLKEVLAAFCATHPGYLERLFGNGSEPLFYIKLNGKTCTRTDLTVETDDTITLLTGDVMWLPHGSFGSIL